MERLYENIMQHIGDPYNVLYLLLFSLWAVFSMFLVTFARNKLKLKTNNSRKIFHIIIFTTAWYTQTFFGFFYVLLYAAPVIIVIGIAVTLGPKSDFYNALCRDTTIKRSKLTVFIPLTMTALGGICNNIFFFTFAPTAYLIAGWGDAMGEIIGANYGRYEYRNPFHKAQKRTIEGSIAVYIGSFIACLIGLIFLNEIACARSVYMSLATAFVIMVVEALATSETDNFFIQIAAGGMLSAMVGM